MCVHVFCICKCMHKFALVCMCTCVHLCMSVCTNVCECTCAGGGAEKGRLAVGDVENQETAHLHLNASLK